MDLVLFFLELYYIVKYFIFLVEKKSLTNDRNIFMNGNKYILL